MGNLCSSEHDRFNSDPQPPARPPARPKPAVAAEAQATLATVHNNAATDTIPLQNDNPNGTTLTPEVKPSSVTGTVASTTADMALGQDVLELVKFYLTGSDAARLLAGACTVYRAGLSQQSSYVWSTFLSQGFPSAGRPAAEAAAPSMTTFERYVRAFLRG